MGHLTRREFLAGAAAAGAFFRGARAFAAAERRSYSVPVLGDIHFDSPDTKRYHALYTHSTTEKRYRAHLAEHVRNAKMWKERMPRLVRASGACARGDAAFALQVGDLVQGDCGDAAVHARMLDDAFALVKGAYGGRLPVVVAAGNHDIRGDIEGDGARETLEKWLPAAMSKELCVPVRDATFAFRQGPDAFIVADFNEPRPDFALLKRLLAESEGARYTFLVSHGPAIPDGRSRWFLLGGGKRDAERRELRALLARRNAIALGGHTHKLQFADCAFPDGRLTQFVFNSVWTRPGQAEPRILAEGEGAAAGAAFAKYAGAAFGALAAEYAPYARRCLHADAAGHYRMDVSDDGVTVAFFGGDAAVPSRTFRLR